MKIRFKRKFDSYLIRDFIKSGGMASIYKAIDTKTGKKVALKILNRNLIKNSDLVTKFLNEGDTIEKLQNDNYGKTDYPIVRITRHSRENNKENGTPFLALEYIDGIDLQDFLIELKKKSLKLSVADSTRIILEVSKALSIIHKRKIWFRDLSPDNIMLLYNDKGINKEKIKIKLIDFGVAKFEYMPPDSLGGALFGKPQYMSPEQCNSQPIDGRSDIYSLGINYFTLLTGNPPFTGNNPIEVIQKHINNAFPKLPSNIPEDITKIIYRMVNKEPNLRYQSIDEVITELQKYLQKANDEKSSDAVYEILQKREFAKSKSSLNDKIKLRSPKKEEKRTTKKTRRVTTIILFISLCVMFLFFLLRNHGRSGTIIIDTTNGIETIKEISDTGNDFYFEISTTGSSNELQNGKIGLIFDKNRKRYYEFTLNSKEYNLIKHEYDESEIISKGNYANSNDEINLAVHQVNNRLFLYINGNGVLKRQIFIDPIQSSNVGILQSANFSKSYEYIISN